MGKRGGAKSGGVHTHSGCALFDLQREWREQMEARLPLRPHIVHVWYILYLVWNEQIPYAGNKFNKLIRLVKVSTAKVTHE